MNVIQQIRVEKITLNMGTGGPGEKMEKAIRLLKNITGRKPVQTKTKKRIPSWGIRPGLSIGSKVTMRKKNAEEFLLRLLQAKNNILLRKHFDENGNFSFGIAEYLDIPVAEYDMQVGIIGFEVAVTLSRPGYRIAKRRINRKKLPKKMRITKEEAIAFMKSKYSLMIKEED